MRDLHSCWDIGITKDYGRRDYDDLYEQFRETAKMRVPLSLFWSSLPLEFLGREYYWASRYGVLLDEAGNLQGSRMSLQVCALVSEGCVWGGK